MIFGYGKDKVAIVLQVLPKDGRTYFEIYPETEVMQNPKVCRTKKRGKECVKLAEWSHHWERNTTLNTSLPYSSCIKNTGNKTKQNWYKSQTRSFRFTIEDNLFTSRPQVWEQDVAVVDGTKTYVTFPYWLNMSLCYVIPAPCTAVMVKQNMF